MQRVMGRFHHRVDRILTGRKLRKLQDRVWCPPPLEDAMVEAGLQEV